jgi:hypothetical protein
MHTRARSRGRVRRINSSFTSEEALARTVEKTEMKMYDRAAEASRRQGTELKRTRRSVRVSIWDGYSFTNA